MRPTTNTALTAAIAAAKEAGRLHQQASEHHDATLARTLAAEPSIDAIKEVWASVPLPPELIIEKHTTEEQRYDVIMTRRYADGREVSTEVLWSASDPVTLTTKRDVDEYYAHDPEGREAALKALSHWEDAKTAAVAARWPEYAELSAIDDAAEKEWEAALDLFDDRLDKLLHTPVSSIEESRAKLDAFLRLNADLHAGRRQRSGRHRGDMTRFVDDETAKKVLSVVVRELTAFAQQEDEDRTRRRQMIAAGVDSLVEAA